MSEMTASLPQTDTRRERFLFLKNVFRFTPRKADDLHFWHAKNRVVLTAALCYALTRFVVFLSMTNPLWQPFALVQVASQIVFPILHVLIGVPVLIRAIQTKRALLIVLQGVSLANALIFAYALTYGIVPLNASYTLGFADIANFGLCVATWLTYQNERIEIKLANLATAFKTSNVGQARLWVSDTETTWTDAKTLKASDKILVFAGERIPRDGIIARGDTSVDESSLTQTRAPIPKSTNDTVFGGTLNRDSEILIEIRGPYQDDLLPVLLQRTQTLIQEKTKLGRTLTLLHKILPALCLIGALGLFFSTSQIFQALAVLLAMPLGFIFLGRAREKTVGELWQRGIVLKSAAALEKLGALKSALFSKTGVLTRGEYAYSQEIIQSGNSLGEFLAVIFSLEDGLDHPIAKAVTEHPWYNELPKAKILNKSFFPGLGVSGFLQAPDQSRFQACVGNLRFMKRNQCQISRELKAKIEEWEDLGETVILCGFEGEVRGIMSFSDTLYRGVSQAMSDIKTAGVATMLLTGDSEKTVTQVLGGNPFTLVHARSTPEDKAAQRLKAPSPFAVVINAHNETVKSSPNQVTIALNAGLQIQHHDADVIVLNNQIENVGFLIAKSKALQRTLLWGVYGSTTLSLALVTATITIGLHPLSCLAASAAWAWFLARRLTR